MKCTLEIYGETHQSTEFSDRHVFGMVAAIGAGGMNLKSLFEQALGQKEIKESILAEAGMDTLFREFDMEVADKNFAYLLKKVFPTISKSIDELSTADMIQVVTPLIKAVVQVEVGADTPIGTVTPTPQSKAIALAPPLMVDLHDWEYPPSASEAQSPEEETAIRYAARTLNVDDWQKVDCWYQWWKAVTDGEDAVDTATTIDVILQLTDQFTALECSQYSSAVLARLETLQQPISA